MRQELPSRGTMSQFKNFWLALIIAVSSTMIQYTHAKIQGASTDGDMEYAFFGGFKEEMFFGDRISLLNKNELADKTWYCRHILDLKIGLNYGKKTYNGSLVECLFALRNKGIWGDPESIARTTESPVKILDVVTGGHRHAIPRHLFWMREGWMKFDLTKMMGFTLTNDHTLTLGAFSFQLGRGIALGDAYAVGPELLGYYTEVNVDQYAFGAKVSGEIIKDKLYYDIYGGILQNKSSTLAETGRIILAQEYGRRANGERGFGKVNFVVASRLQWWPIYSEKYGSLMIEPYALFNDDPEQKVEFVADATSKLGTLGLATEYLHDRFEFGFEYAQNVGQQRVKGWDRNHIQLAVDPTTGFMNEVNSHVLDAHGNKIVFNPSNKSLTSTIETTFQNESQNDQPIGFNASQVTTGAGNTLEVVNNVELFNANNRFRNPYVNSYEGWMFVADMSAWIYKKDLQLALAVGITSGDDDPNEISENGEFDGFISLQEIYSGKRVQSAFVLGGAGKLKRSLSAPTSIQAPNRFARVVDNFSNLIFCGMGFTWNPVDWKKEFSFNPNILAYWQEKPIRKFDAKTQMELPQLASTFLGVEANLFSYYYPVDELKVYFVGSIFFPGKHYTDIEGKPFTPAQAAALNRFNATGFNAERVPNISDNAAFTSNFGVEFKF
jgi:hypothetical protein